MASLACQQRPWLAVSRHPNLCPAPPTVRKHHRTGCRAITSGPTTPSTGPISPTASTSSPSVPAPPPLPQPPIAYTVSSMYLPKREYKEFAQIDHAAKRRERETKEIIEAAKRIGMNEAAVRENIAYLESLLPDLQPNLDKMKAADWVKLVADVPRVASMLITLKTAFPTANVSAIVRKTPKLLLQPAPLVADNADKIRQILSRVDGPGELDAIIEAVPNLLDPRQLALSLSNLARWFPSQHPVEVLRSNPTLLLNVEEADLAADPTYDWEST